MAIPWLLAGLLRSMTHNTLGIQGLAYQHLGLTGPLQEEGQITCGQPHNSADRRRLSHAFDIICTRWLHSHQRCALPIDTWAHVVLPLHDVQVRGIVSGREIDIVPTVQVTYTVREICWTKPRLQGATAACRAAPSGLEHARGHRSGSRILRRYSEASILTITMNCPRVLSRGETR
jgi:hypothetical protein